MVKNIEGLLGKTKAKIGVIMGSQSDWATMREACTILDQFDVEYEQLVVSAHRTPAWMFQYAQTADDRGLEIIIAGAGGAAHLPGMVAASTVLPVLGVPIESKALSGMDSLLSIVQMPGGVPVGTLAIGTAGAKNAALLALRILSLQDAKLKRKLEEFHHKQTQGVLDDVTPRDK
ncbi:MAG: 5-(carboxyamino)imidazole ribonucleotide mutase [Pirellula sp.]|jgi:5-(carboxyamino)imidazole ribonucleotide mutase